MRVTTDRRRCARLCAGPDQGAGDTRVRRSGTRRLQIPQPDQVMRAAAAKGELPIHEGDAAMPELAQAPDGLHPSKDLFHEFPFPLTDVIARMPRGPAIDRAPADLLRHVGRDVPDADVGHEARHIVALVRPRPCCPEVRWPPATAPPPRVRQSPSRGSHRRWRRALVDCPAARGPDTPAWPPSPGPSGAASPPDRSSTGACRCAAAPRGS